MTGHRGGSTFQAQSFQSGGMGAHPNNDGLAATPFPSGVKAIAVEITEALTPLVVWRKELRADSGGAGLRRGGMGQVMEVGSREDAPFAVFARFERVENPARGRSGGSDGAAGTVALTTGKTLNPKGTHVIAQGERLIVEMPGGGGFGDPRKRPAEEIAEDLRNGYVTPEGAASAYGAVIGKDGKIDLAATRANRAG